MSSLSDIGACVDCSYGRNRLYRMDQDRNIKVIVAFQNTFLGSLFFTDNCTMMPCRSRHPETPGTMVRSGRKPCRGLWEEMQVYLSNHAAHVILELLLPSEAVDERALFLVHDMRTGLKQPLHHVDFSHFQPRTRRRSGEQGRTWSLLAAPARHWTMTSGSRWSPWCHRAMFGTHDDGQVNIGVGGSRDADCTCLGRRAESRFVAGKDLGGMRRWAATHFVTAQAVEPFPIPTL